MNVLITGSKGFIGQHLTRYHTLQGDTVQEYDITDGKDVVELYDQTIQADMIVHAAAYCSIRGCVADPLRSFYDNAYATHSVFECARKNDIPTVIYFSSSRVLSPEENPYTAAKKYGEHLALAYRNCYGIITRIIRPSTVYGEGDVSDRIIPRFIRNALTGKPLVIYGDAKKTLNPMYITDFMARYDYLIHSTLREIDALNPQAVLVRDIAQEILKITNSSSEIMYEPAETQQPQEIQGIQTEQQITTLLEGLTRTIHWLRTHEKLDSTSTHTTSPSKNTPSTV